MHPLNLSQVFAQLLDLLLTFCASAGTSVNFSQISMRPRTFLQLSMLPWDFRLLREFFVHPRIFRKHSMCPLDLPSSFVNFPCIRRTFCHLLSAFCVVVGPFVNLPCIRMTIRQHSVHQRELPSSSLNFPCVRGTCQQFGHLQDPLSNFHVTTRPTLNFHKFSVHSKDLL